MPRIISRQEAIAQGLTKYYTGKTCKWGHLSERTVYDKHCVICKRDRQKKHRVKHGPYIPNIKSHIWSLLRHVKSQRKSKKASVLEFDKKQFSNWFEKNYNGKCYYCEITLEQYEKEKKFLKVKVPGFRFGIDRKNSQDTYNLDNIAISCSICNSAKSFVFDADEFKKIARKYIRKLYA